MTALETEIQAAKNVLVENIEKLIERGEKIDLLVEKTETLQVCNPNICLISKGRNFPDERQV